MRVRPGLWGRSVAALLALAVFLAFASPGKALALPPAGSDVLVITAEVGITSNLGSETIDLSGTVTIERGDPYLDGGVEVVDAEITALDLTGASVTGTVSVGESATEASLGELRGLQPAPQGFPASSFFDVFVVVEAPASPDPFITLHNDVPLHLVPMKSGSEAPIDAWPPLGKIYQTYPDPCLPLLPFVPVSACITSMLVGFGPNPVGGIAELPSDEQGREDSASESSSYTLPVAAGVSVGVAGLSIAFGGVVGYAIRRWHR